MRHVVKTTRPAPFKRTGLHRIECESCTGYAYATVANLQTVGTPGCACGSPMHAERLELALLLGDDAAPVVAEWKRRTDRKERAQMPAGKRPCQLRENLASMSDRAATEIIAERASDARARRLRAIAPAPEPLPF